MKSTIDIKTTKVTFNKNDTALKYIQLSPQGTNGNYSLQKNQGHQ